MITGAGNEPRFLFSLPDFEVLGFSGTEGMNELYQFQIELVTAVAVLDWDKLVGQKAQLMILGPENTVRHVNGIIARFELVAVLPRQVICHALLVPPHARMTLKRRLRVFQDLTTQEIVTQVLGESGITALEWPLRESYKPRNYCVQYRESDMAFVSRLLEEEGIAYHFEHTDKELRTVFTDHNDLLQPIAGKAQVVYNAVGSMAPDEEFVRDFSFKQQMASGKVQLRDYSFKKPRLDLKGEATGADPSLEVYDFPGEFVDAGLGQRLASTRLQELEQEQGVGRGASDCMRMVPGQRFTLGGALPGERHGREQLNREYLLLQVAHTGHQDGVLAEEGDQSSTRYSNTFQVMPAKVPFRPPRLTPRPLAMGAHSATVVGPKGKEIYVDPHGRVKLRFHWDREDKSTSWVRVAQPWAGAGFGAQFLPRVGQEVLVGFLEGDPDRPVVLGQLYNGEQVVPYDLPKHKTRSTIRSMSSPAQAGGFSDVSTGLVNEYHAHAGFNELRFEDATGKEEVLLHAERDHDVVVENDRTTLVKHDRVEAIRRNQSLKVGNNLTVNVQESSVHMATRVLLEAREKLTARVGGTTLELTPASLQLLGADLLASATQTHDLKGGLVKINAAGQGASAASALKGSGWGFAAGLSGSGAPGPGADAFVRIDGPSFKPPDKVSTKGKAVFARYQEQLALRFQISARDLADGRLRREPSREDAQKWLTGLLQDLPLCDTPIGQGLGQLFGLSDEQLALPPGELGQELGQTVKHNVTGWVKSQEHPALFWSAAALVAVGAGALTYYKGTSILEKVGIDPEISKSFFGDKVTLDGSGGFGPELSDPTAQLRAEEKISAGLTLYQEVKAGGPDLGHLGVEELKLGADYSKQLNKAGDELGAGLGYARNLTTDSESLTGYIKGKSGDVSYGVNGMLDPSSTDHSVEAYVGRQFGKNGSIEGFARHQSFGGVSDQSVGVMLKFTF